MEPTRVRIKEVHHQLVEDLRRGGKETVARIGERLWRERGLWLRFDVSPDETVNAAAYPVRGLDDAVQGYGIQLNRGVLVNLDLLSKALLSRDDVMPDLGSAGVAFGSLLGLDLSSLHWGDDLYRQIARLEDEGALLVRMPAPRHSAARQVVLYGFLFVLWHEIGHLQRGHADWYCSAAGRLRLDERRESHAISPLASQALELAADAHGGLAVATSLLQASDPHEAARLCGFAVGLVFQTFEFMRKPLSGYSRRSHPHPGLRLVYTGSGMVGRARKYGVDLPDSVEASWLQGLTESAAACQLIGAEKALSPIVGTPEHDQALEGRLTEILDELDRLTAGPLHRWIW